MRRLYYLLPKKLEIVAATMPKRLAKIYQGLMALRDYGSYLFMNCQYQSGLLPYPLNGMRIWKYFVIEKLLYLWQKMVVDDDERNLFFTIGSKEKKGK